MDNYLENHIVNFAHILRGAGVMVVTSEVLDALNALPHVDLRDKSQFEAALSSVMVKNRSDWPKFHQAFASYFVDDACRSDQMDTYSERKEEVATLKQDLSFRDNPLELTKDDIDIYASLPDDARKSIREFIIKTNEGINVEERHRPMLERAIRGALEYHRSRMNSQDIIPIETTGNEEWDAILYNMAKNRDNQEIIFKDMMEIQDDELREATVLIRNMARRLATRIGRRYKRSSKVHAVDIRNSMRQGLRYGGVLLNLKYRRQRVQKPNIVLITDISGSMLKYSRFLIQLMLGLKEVLPNMQGFAFAENLEKLNFRSFYPDDFGRLDGIGQGTNLNQSLREFMDKYRYLLTKRTVLIILSDTKSREYQEASLLLREIHGQVKEIIWLNPVAKHEWRRYPMTEAFREHATMYEAASFEDLARALKHI